MMIDTTADCLAVTRAKTKGKLLFLSMDAASKDGVQHMVKIIAC